VAYISDFENFLLVESDSTSQPVFNGIWDPMVDGKGKRHWRLNVLVLSKLKKIAEEAHNHFQGNLQTELKDVVLLCPANFTNSKDDLDLVLIVEKRGNLKKGSRSETEEQMNEYLSDYVAENNPHLRGKEVEIEASTSNYFPKKLGVYSLFDNKWLQPPPSDQHSDFVGLSAKKIIGSIKKLDSSPLSEISRKKIQKISRQIQRLKKSGPTGTESYNYLLSGGYIHEIMDLLSRK
jgi:hypothetical protein